MLLPTVEALGLARSASPTRFPIFGGIVAGRYESSSGEPAEAWLGLDSYAWGGEHIDVFQLDVPARYLGEPLTLTATGNASFDISDEDGNLLVSGNVGEQIDEGGFQVQVKELVARPGTQFEVTRQRRLNTILQYQEELGASERGKDSGIIALHDADTTDVQRAANETVQAGRMAPIDTIHTMALFRKTA